MAAEKFNLDTATAIGSLIGEQADQLWTAAMALIVAEVFIGCRYFIDREDKFRWRWTGSFWASSIICYLASLLFGYLTKGALIIMTLEASQDADTSKSFGNAGLMALLQAGFLFLGLVLFALAFRSDFKRLAKAISEAK